MSAPSSQKVFTKDQTVLRDGLIYHKDTNELVTGIVEEVRDNGQLERIVNYIDGKKDGLYESFHENGQLRFRSNYRENHKDGKLDGLWEEFDRNGQLAQV